MNGLALLAAAALYVLLGLLGSRLSSLLVSPADGAFFRLVLYVMSGAVVLHVVLTLFDLAGLPWSPLLLAVLGAALLALAQRFLPRGPERARRPGGAGWGDALALFALVAFTLVALSGWITFPDFVYHWGAKARHFEIARGVDYAYLARGWNWYTHPDYPNLVPELFTVTALVAGGFDLPSMMLGTGILFALLLAATSAGLRQGGVDRFTRQAGQALVALSVAAFGLGHLMAGAADWLLALAVAAALPPLLRPADRSGDFQLGTIAAFAAAAKIEGVPFALFLVLTHLTRRLRANRRVDLGSVLRTGLPVAAVVLPWAGRVAFHHLALATNSGPFHLSRAGEIFAAVGEAVSLRAWHGFILAAFLPPLFLLHRRLRPFAVVATLQLAFYFYSYFTAGFEGLRLFVLSNFPRLAFQWVPASLVAMLVAWGGRYEGGGGWTWQGRGQAPPLGNPAGDPAQRGVVTTTTLP